MSICTVCVSAQEQERAAFLAAQKVFPQEINLRVHGHVDDFFTDLEQLKSSDTHVVVIGAHIEELAQLYLVVAVSAAFPHVTVIVVLPTRDSDMVNRAMLAGASAALAIDWSDKDLLSAIRRVTKAAKGTQQNKAEGKPKAKSVQKNILSFVSAKGGSGKSTFCALCAYRFAQSGLSVAVVDFDLQFGDMRFVFNVEPTKTLFDLLGCLDSPALPAQHFGMSVAENIMLFSPEQAPEKAELFYGKAAALLQRVADEFDVVLVNTGSFWTLLHIELLEASSQVVCLTEQGIISSRATQSLLALCAKLNLPTSQFIYVVNKLEAYGLSANDICEALSIRAASSLDIFSREFSMLMDAGNALGAYAIAEKRDSFEAVIRVIAQKMGLQLNSVQAMQASMKKSSWRWFK